MRKLLLSASVLFMPLPAIMAQTTTPEPPRTMPIPADYREWQYLTSGTDMSYNEPTTAANATGHTMFDNVFVNREAWAGYKQNGTWPNGTVMVLENRMGEGNVSINKQGKTQNAEVMGLEIHAKVNGQWAFYVRGRDGQEQLVAKPASCYTCHESHAAVDTTFAQFYPTALPIAKSKGTISQSYLKDLEEPKNTPPVR